MGAAQILLLLQLTQATVVGTVRDGATGEPLAGAEVALPDLDRAAVTDGRGRYLLRDVPAGPQHLSFRFLGYAHRTLHALVPPAGALEINVSLRPDPIPLRALEVRPLLPVRGVEVADRTDFPDRGVSGAAVRTHPLLAEPDAFQALSGGEVILKPESPSGMHVRGGAADQTAYLLDGIPIFSPYHASGVFSAWNPDALARLDLLSAAPSPSFPHTLSGAVVAVTRTPGSRFRAQGSASTTQARLTVDGPVGVAGAGFLLSLRSGFTGLLASKNEATYVRGETGDWLAKAEAPAFGGQLRVLGYDSENEVDAAAAAEGEVDPAPYAARNTFEWHSRSFGAAWTGSFRGRTLRLQGWRAASDASAFWTRAPVALILGAKRRDEGALAALEHSDARATTVAGVRFERSRTSYDVGAFPTEILLWNTSARTPIVSGFLQHARPIHSRLDLEVGASLAAAAGSVYPGPRARLRWKPWGESTLSLSYARLHQFAQSLRNPESVAGNIFPADLYLGAGAAAVPVGRSDQGVIAAEVRPWPGIRLGLQAYGRALDGLVLVAPRQGEPFATGGFAAGSGASRGLAIDLAASGTRYGVVASYGWQRVRLAYGDSSYVPDHGSAHVIEAGATVFPTATSSIRLGIAGALGRRTTAVAGAFEWESCNLLDQGCEFAGAPHASASPGTATLPHYLRVDLGVRKHWDVEIGGRNAWVALFGTVTNVFARRNVLTYAEDPASGERVLIEMRPRAPLVVGLDWQF